MAAYDARVEREIIALENQWMEAWRTHDIERSLNILHEDFTLTSALSHGDIIDRPTWLKHAVQDYEVESYSYDKTNVRVYGDVAIVTGLFRQKARAHKDDWSGDFLITDVWIRDGDTWKIVHRHGSRPLKK